MAKQKKTNSVSLNIRLTKKQVKMYNALNSNKYKEVLFYGSSRSGKTFLIIYWMIVQCVCFKANCLVIRALLTSLKQGMLKQTLPAVLGAICEHNGYELPGDPLRNCPIIMSNGQPMWTYNGAEYFLQFYNGGYIQFASLRGSADSEKAFDKILSTEWRHIFGDEASEIEWKSVDVIKSRHSQKTKDLEGQNVRGKMIFALNPTRKTGWTYVRYFKNESTDGLAIPEKMVNQFLVVKFAVADNIENVDEDYLSTLEGMSVLARKRFLEGDYFDESEGEIFKKINWTTPDDPIQPHEWSNLIIYTDPSAKDNKNTDFKASVLIGKARNAYYLIDCRAVQGTSFEMLQNIHELYLTSPVPEITRIYMESRQIPNDWKNTYDAYQQKTGWICHLEWDKRNMGDKFTAIEGNLEPLFRYDKFFFNHELKDTQRGELAVNQFLFFSAKVDNTRKDDIPDACMRAVTLLNRFAPIKYEHTPDSKISFVRKKRTKFF